MDFATFLTKLKENGGYEAWARAFGAVPAGQLSAQCDDRLKYFFAELRRAPSPSLPQGAGGFFVPVGSSEPYKYDRAAYRDKSRAAFELAVGALQGNGKWFLDYLGTGKTEALTPEQRAFVGGWDRLMMGLMDSRVADFNGSRSEGQLNFLHLIELSKDRTVNPNAFFQLLKKYGFSDHELRAMGPELAMQWSALAGGVIQGAVSSADMGIANNRRYSRLLESLSYSGGISQVVIQSLDNGFREQEDRPALLEARTRFLQTGSLHGWVTTQTSARLHYVLGIGGRSDKTLMHNLPEEMRMAVVDHGRAPMTTEQLAILGEQRVVSGPDRLTVTDFATLVERMKTEGGYPAWLAAHTTASYEDPARAATLGFDPATRAGMMRYFYPRLQQPSEIKGEFGEYSVSDFSVGIRPDNIPLPIEINFTTRTKGFRINANARGEYGGFFMPISPENLPQAAKALQGGGQWFLDYLKYGERGFTNWRGVQLTEQQRAFVQGFDRVMVGFMDAGASGINQERMRLLNLVPMRRDETVTGAELASVLKKFGFTDNELQAMGPELATQWVALVGGVMQNAIRYVEAPARTTETKLVQDAVQKSRFVLAKFAGLFSPAAQAELMRVNSGSTADLPYAEPAATFEEVLRRAVVKLNDPIQYTDAFDQMFIAPVPRMVNPTLKDHEIRSVACDR